jgi:hypothetical protein
MAGVLELSVLVGAGVVLLMVPSLGAAVVVWAALIGAGALSLLSVLWE